MGHTGDACWWELGTAVFDARCWELRVDGVPAELERKPLEVLACLLEHAGEVVPRQQLLDCVWAGRVVVEAALTNAISKLRKVLPGDVRLVTVPRVGYRLEGRVKQGRMVPPGARLQLAGGDPVPRRPNWRLVERIATTAGHEVWRAAHAETGEVRVFKFGLDRERLDALQQEVAVAGVLREALGTRRDLNRVLDWDFSREPFFVELEYGGQTLDQWLAGRPDTPRDERLAVMAAVADAVAAVHRAGVLHRDLRPSNVLIQGEPGAWEVRVADFGCSLVLRPEPGDLRGAGMDAGRLPASTESSGAAFYLAPELLTGLGPSVASDMYALGVMLWQLLAGDFRRPLAPGWELEVGDTVLERDIADFAHGDARRRPACAEELAARLRTVEARKARLDAARELRKRIAAAEREQAVRRARRPWLALNALLLALWVSTLLYM